MPDLFDEGGSKGAIGLNKKYKGALVFALYIFINLINPKLLHPFATAPHSAVALP